MRKLFTSVTLFLCFIALFFACKKTDSAQEDKVVPSKDKFFTVPDDAPKQIKAVAQALEKQNERHNYLSSIIKKAGYPRWDKAKVITLDGKRVNARAGSDSTGEIVYVPFVRDSQNYVNSILRVKLNASDTVYRMLYDRNYQKFGFDTTDHSKWNARDVFHVFTSFDYSVFGHTQFRVKDPRIFGRDSGILNAELVSGTGRSTAKVSTFVEVCTNYMVCESCAGSVARQAKTTIVFCCNPSYFSVCTTYDTEGGGGSGTYTGWTGSGDGSGGSGGGWYGGGSDPCAGSGLLRTSTAIPDDGCSSGWQPVGDSRIYNGVTYSISNYPGMEFGFPWLWWENEMFLIPYGGVGFGSWAINYLSLNFNLSFPVFRNQFMQLSEGPDGSVDETFWDNPNNAYPPQDLPVWSNFEAAFPKRSDPNYDTPQELYASIGGDVYANGYTGPSSNTCAARVSKALNYSGVTIPNIPGKTFKGNDGKYYFLGAANLNRWMRKTFGCANPNTSIGEYLNNNSVHYNASQIGTNGENLPTLLNGVQGVYSMVSSNPSWATGHSDLLNPGPTPTCDGGCHFDGPVKYIDVWKLQ